MSLIEKALAKKKAETKPNTKPEASKVNKVEQEAQASGTKSAEIHQEPAAIMEAKVESEPPKVNTPNKVVPLNVEHLAQHGMILPDENRSKIKEEFRFIKRKILKNAFGSQASLLEHPNLIMVTSANPNEGKSFSAVNLALSIALEQDKMALLVDADVLRPSVCRTLGIEEPKLGLIDYLDNDDVDLSETIQHTDVPRLKILSSGRRHHLTSELIGSEKMAELAKELSTRYPDRVIIFDAPPLLGVNESQNLASLVGQVLLVVEEDKTTHRDVENAMYLLDPDKAIGCILNKASRKRSQVYGYGYGNYYN